MKIEFVDHGPTATLTITSSLLEFRRHNRAVDAVQLTGCIHVLPASKTVHIKRSGFFYMRTAINGYTPTVMSCYRAAMRGACK